jgi:hypothetical protein
MTCSKASRKFVNETDWTFMVKSQRNRGPYHSRCCLRHFGSFAGDVNCRLGAPDHNHLLVPATINTLVCEIMHHASCKLQQPPPACHLTFRMHRQSRAQVTQKIQACLCGQKSACCTHTHTQTYIDQVGC